MKRRSPPSRTETAVSMLLLGCLVLIGWAIWQKQFQFNEEIFRIDLAAEQVQAAQSSETADEGWFGIALSDILSTGVTTAGKLEEFDRENLSDKIDGRAELYLEAGFQKLLCRRFALTDSPDAWFELFVYDMANATNAFAVFSAQRRAGNPVPEIGALAYATANAVYFASGRYYVELIGSSDTNALRERIQTTARLLAQKLPRKNDELAAVGLLPLDALVPGSIRLILKDAYGFDQLDHVVTADYHYAATTVTVFLSVRPKADEATELAEAYYRFLKDDMGAETVEIPSWLPQNLRVLNALGQHEIVGARGPVLFGIHAAPSLDSARRILEEILRNMEAQQR